MNTRPRLAFILSLAGGALIFIGGVSVLVVVQTVFSQGGSSPFLVAFYYELLQKIGFATGPAFVIVVLTGILPGIVILFGSLMTFLRPAASRTWGILILVSAFVSLIGSGGFLIGAILCVIGGAFAVTWRERRMNPNIESAPPKL